MKIETYLNAMELAASEATMQNAMLGAISPTTKRQYHAFRSRILKMDTEKDVEIEYLTDANLAMYRQLTEVQHRYKFKMEDWISSK